MRYSFIAEGTRDEREASTDKLLREFLGYPGESDKPPAEVDELLMEYLGKADAVLSETDPEKKRRAPVRSRVIMPKTKAGPKIDLCETCTTLNEAVAARMLYVLISGVVIVKPDFSAACLDEIEIDPSLSNPLRCCMGCGHVMNDSVCVERPDVRLPHADVCCRGMQIAMTSGSVRLLRFHAFTSGFLVSHGSSERIRFKHCGWCGMWLQLLHHAQALGPEFIAKRWDRRHHLMSH